MINVKDSMSFDVKKIVIISAMVWLLFSVVGNQILFSLLFIKSHEYYNYLFVDINYFAMFFGLILAVLLVSYYGINNPMIKNRKIKEGGLSKNNIPIKYLLKITLLLMILKIGMYILKIYTNVDIPIDLFYLSDGVIGYVLVMGLFFKIHDLQNKSMSFLSKLKTIAISIIIWFLISYPLYWMANVFITPDYFGYPRDYDHFNGFKIFIYVIGALLSIPASIYLNFKKDLNTDCILKECWKIVLLNSFIAGTLGLIFFTLFTIHYHHVCSVEYLVYLVFFLLLIRTFKIIGKNEE
ncbi:hypothetical protein [Methanothermococcus sp.]|uniref:hypothetical protein n=1 Tax=Methanothermococcus sp. TaxID=2614238 RepID=UPI0025D356B5|nr:hypothetical protein [Methanothermococcus sp.]